MNGRTKTDGDAVGSLRLRIVLGAVLWTTGLFTAAGLLLTQVMYRHPGAPGVFHGWFLNVGPLALLAVVALLAGLSQVRHGLSSFDRLRTRLLAVREGRSRRIDGTYPVEVQPLVKDLNALLAEREARVARAQQKAGDLAHGLKTPLAVLTLEAGRARTEGHESLATAVTQQVERMQRQIDYHLAQARAAASGATPGTRASLAEAAGGLVRTMRTLHADRGLMLDVAVPDDLSVRSQREDVEEMLGNLLDNACKWARTRVAIASAREGDLVMTTVDDDGPGLDPALHEAALQRGVRVDEAAPGSGLGLAIVRDLAELYGGTITLDRSPLGGLQARLTLPSA